MTTRIERLQASMRDGRTDLCAVGPGADMAYLCGARPHPDERLCLLLVGPDAQALVMPALNADEVRSQTDVAMHTHADEAGPQAALQAAVRAVGAEGAQLVAVEDAMRTDFTLTLLEAFPGALPRRLSELLAPLRARKDDAELAALRVSAAQADDAIRAVAAAARVGVSERDVALAAQASFRAAGAEPAFGIVGSGPNGAHPHHASGDRTLAPGDAVVVDVGATFEGYCSDITRMLVMGEPSARYREVHEVVERAVQAALAAVRPGARGREVDQAARRVIEEAGFGPNFLHRTGHGIGMSGHEPPYLTATSETVLEAGMTHSVEPGIYLPGEFGVRLEEVVVVTDDGCEVLSRLPRDPIVI
jgi:Xaa-Pro aminopeptidase